VREQSQSGSWERVGIEAVGRELELATTRAGGQIHRVRESEVSCSVDTALAENVSREQEQLGLTGHSPWTCSLIAGIVQNPVVAAPGSRTLCNGTLSRDVTPLRSGATAGRTQGLAHSHVSLGQSSLSRTIQSWVIPSMLYPSTYAMALLCSADRSTHSYPDGAGHQGRLVKAGFRFLWERV
jgi:hypothetical protein